MIPSIKHSSLNKLIKSALHVHGNMLNSDFTNTAHNVWCNYISLNLRWHKKMKDPKLKMGVGQRARLYLWFVTITCTCWKASTKMATLMAEADFGV